MPTLMLPRRRSSALGALPAACRWLPLTLLPRGSASHLDCVHPYSEAAPDQTRPRPTAPSSGSGCGVGSLRGCWKCEEQRGRRVEQACR
eukprot:3115489-Rhodomonas_salina.2